MIKTDYKYSSINQTQLKELENKILNIVDSFESKTCLGNDFIGWYTYLDNINEEYLETTETE